MFKQYQINAKDTWNREERQLIPNIVKREYMIQDGKHFQILSGRIGNQNPDKEITFNEYALLLMASAKKGEIKAACINTEFKIIIEKPN